MIINRSVIIIDEVVTVAVPITIETDCSLSTEQVEEIEYKYCTSIIKQDDYRLQLLDAMKIESCAVVSSMIDSPLQICYNIAYDLMSQEFTYVSVNIQHIGSFTINKKEIEDARED